MPLERSMTKKKANVVRPQAFYVVQILDWADTFHRRHGRWPMIHSGRISGTDDDTWRRVDSALRLGLRGLQSGSSLPRLLAEKRGVRNSKNLPRLTYKQILMWADAHYKRTGQWPKETSGKVRLMPSESWHAIDRALRAGVRGLHGASSLAQLLARYRKVRNIQQLPRFAVKLILLWADQYYAHTGRWPDVRSGAVRGSPGETWMAVQAALQNGRRGLPGGSTLPRLLAEHRGVRNPRDLPRLTAVSILMWVDKHYRRTGRWPTSESGPIVDAPGETWRAVDTALKGGWRGFGGGSSLARLLNKYRRMHRKNQMVTRPKASARLMPKSETRRPKERRRPLV
jgi:hypothetical protein